MNKVTLDFENKTDEKLSENNLYKTTSDIFKAIGHEGRLKILYELHQSEKTVSMLEESLPYKQAAISQQLARLRFSGIVNCRREGKMIYYKIANKKISNVLNMISNEF